MVGRVMKRVTFRRPAESYLFNNVEPVDEPPDFPPGGTMPIPDRSFRGAKVRATLYLSCDVLEEARNAAVHLAGYPARLTLAKLADNALRAELTRLKLLYNHGQEFPPRDADLQGGRPIAA
jgi:hypothetical protein